MDDFKKLCSLVNDRRRTLTHKIDEYERFLADKDFKRIVKNMGGRRYVQNTIHRLRSEETALYQVLDVAANVARGYGPGFPHDV